MLIEIHNFSIWSIPNLEEIDFSLNPLNWLMMNLYTFRILYSYFILLKVNLSNLRMILQYKLGNEQYLLGILDCF